MLLQRGKFLFETLNVISLRASRNMSSHLERTGDVKRSKCNTEATVVQIQNVSATVKALKLQIKNNQFSFKAGQWVDFFIPNLDIIGGFSMYSSPKSLEDSRMLDLAVKYSTHRPAHWVHKECKVGDVVILTSGGECIWEPNNLTQRKNTLLIAGGIGINPVFSILQHIEETRRLENHKESHKVGKSILLYSASTKNELIFKEQLDALSSESEMLSCQFYITKEPVHAETDTNFRGQRITHDTISNAVQMLNDQKGTQCFICGPPPMIQNMVQLLTKNGVSASDINYEQWW